MLRKKSPLLKTTTKHEDQIIDQNNGLEAKISKENRITIMIDLQEASPHLIRIFPQGQTSHMGITIRAMEDHMINVQISHLIEAMEIDPELIF